MEILLILLEDLQSNEQSGKLLMTNLLYRSEDEDENVENIVKY